MEIHMFLIADFPVCSAIRYSTTLGIVRSHVVLVSMF